MLLDDASGQQQAQSIGEDVGRNAESGVDIVVAMQTKEKRRKEQGCPTITNGIDGMKHRRVDTFGMTRGRCALTSTSCSFGTERITRAGSRCRSDIVQAHRLVAMGAGERGLEVVATASMPNTRRQAVFTGPAMLPAPHAKRDGIKAEAFFSETILKTARRFAVGHSIKNAVLDECIEARRERAASGAGATPEIFEAADAQECIAQNQKRPTITECFERASPFTAAQQIADRVDVLWQFTARHDGGQFNTRGVINR